MIDIKKHGETKRDTVIPLKDIGKLLSEIVYEINECESEIKDINKRLEKLERAGE